MTRFVRNCGLFLIALCAVQWIVGRLSLPRVVRALESAATGDLDILFLGDSTDGAFGRSDDDYRPLSERLAALLPDRELLSLAQPAFSGPVFRAVCARLTRSEHRPRMLVVTVNLRSFSVAWRDRPAYQFRRERFALQHAMAAPFYRPLEVLGALDGRLPTTQEFLAAEVRDGEDVVGVAGNFLPEDPQHTDGRERDDLFLLHYMAAMESDDPLLGELAAVAHWCRRHGVRGLFYVTPVDIASGERAHPARFRRRVRTNVAVIREAIEGAGGRFLDLSELVPSPHFAWEQEPNEHLDQVGKGLVAARLARAIRGQD